MDGHSADASSKVQSIAARIWRAWMDDELLDQLPVDLRPLDADEGFAAQQALDVWGGRRLGWKIAATSAAGQAHIGVDGPLPGRLYERFAFEDDAELPSHHLHMAVVEAELAFRFRETVDADGLSTDDVAAAVEDMHLAIEIPDSRFAAFETVGAPQLLADNACAGRFVLGPVVLDWRRFDLAAQPVHLHVNGELVARGAGSNVLGHPLAALTWVANDLARRRDPIRAGEVVTTGTTTVPAPIGPGAKVRATFDGMGEVRVSFA